MEKQNHEEPDEFIDDCCCICFSLKTGAKLLTLISILGLGNLILSYNMLGMTATRTFGILFLCAQVPQIVSMIIMVKWFFVGDSNDYKEIRIKSRENLPLAQLLQGISMVLYFVLKIIMAPRVLD